MSEISCAKCQLVDFCATQKISKHERLAIEKPLPKQSGVIDTKHLAASLYALKTGALKKSPIEHEGADFITDFILPGEAFITKGSFIEALEDCLVCIIPLKKLHSLTIKNEHLQNNFFNLMQGELRRSNKSFLLTKQEAKERVLNFLLDLQERLHLKKHQSFTLPMSRADIANYLGLTTETVSRIMTKLHKEQQISISSKQVQILT